MKKPRDLPHLYVARRRRLTKIGVTINVKARMAEICKKHPGTKLVRSWDLGTEKAMAVEYACRIYLKDHLRYGSSLEWFNLPADDVLAGAGKPA